MAYTVNISDGTVLAVVNDGTINSSSSSITLIGKNYSGYGEIYNENIVHVMENFANATAPANPLQGQCWWDKTNTLLKVYNGTSWKVISSSTAQATAPTGPVVGDLWWDTANDQLKAYNGSTWIIVGPGFTSVAGTSGAIVETITDTLSNPHVVIKEYVANTVVSIVSKDATFTPQTAIAGFTTIKPGKNLVDDVTITGARYHGQSTDSELLNGLSDTQFLRSDQSDSTSGALTVANDTGLIVGVDSDFGISVAGSNVNLTNSTLNGDILLRTTDGGGTTTMIAIDGSAKKIGVQNAAPEDDLTVGATGADYSLGVWGAGDADQIKIRNSGFTDPSDFGIFGSTNSGMRFGFWDDSMGSSAYPLVIELGAANNLMILDSAVQQVQTEGHIVPGTDSTYNLGGSGNEWLNLYADNLYGTIQSGAQTGITSLGTLTSLTISGALTVGGLTSLNGSVNLGDATADTISFVGRVGGGIDPDTDNVYNLGSGSLRWANVYGSSFVGQTTSTQWADIAERFEADDAYEAGTVLRIGGEAELTVEDEDNSKEAFGVVSEKPGVILNTDLEDTPYNPVVALTGRTPVKVQGPVEKGQRLVSAGNGYARAITSSDSIHAIIGRALETKTTENVENIMTFVRANV